MCVTLPHISKYFNATRVLLDASCILSKVHVLRCVESKKKKEKKKALLSFCMSYVSPSPTESELLLHHCNPNSTACTF
jgi:hypothetical protein